MATHRRTRDGMVGPSTRPVAIPDDVADPAIEKATGVIKLPPHVRAKWLDWLRGHSRVVPTRGLGLSGW